MAPSPPHPAAAARLRADLQALLGAVPERLGVAVSGGPDSVALLLLAREVLGPGVEAATVDHGLRAESRDEAQFVSDLCRALGVQHRILQAGPLHGSPQQAARTARYRLLSAWAAERALPWIATAHHRDDQAETFLMRAVRGAGLSGLAGIRAVVPAGQAADLLPHGGGLLRPVLGWSRAELAQVVAAAGIHPVADPSNTNPAYDRTAFRELLAREPLLEAEGLARAAQNLCEAEAALAYAAAAAWADHVSEAGGALLLRPGPLPRELLRRLAGRIVRALSGQEARGSQLAALVDTLARGGRGNVAGVLAQPGTVWRFAPEPARKTLPIINHSPLSPTLPTRRERLSRAQRKAADE